MLIEGGMGYLVVIFDEGTPDLATTTTTCQRVISRYGSYFSFFQQFHISGVLLGLSTTASHHFLVHLTWVVGCFFLLLRRYDDHISSLEESPGGFTNSLPIYIHVWPREPFIKAGRERRRRPSSKSF